MDFRDQIPTRIHFGTGTFEGAGATCATLGRRPFVVTTRTAMQRLGYLQRLQEQFEAEGLHMTVFHDYRASPTTDDVDAGAEQARSSDADLVVALGGGSAIDVAKAIAAAAPGMAQAADFLYGRAQPTEATLPIVAIPTTAGSGSETNRSAIVTDAARHFKEGIRSDHLFPRHAIVDPSLTYHADPALTAQTGFDALAHAIESYVSPKAQDVHDTLALQAIDAIARNLPTAMSQPDHADAREALARASTSMGVNLTCVGTCLPHRVDKCICGLHPHIPHGQSLALIYPTWVRRSLRGRPERFAHVAGLLHHGDAERGAAEGVPDAMRAFIETVGLDARPDSFGLASEQVPALMETLGDTSVDPVPAEREEMSDMFSEIIAGD